MEWIFAGIMGLIVGSFLNVLIHRLPRMLFRQWKIQSQEFLATHSSTESSTYSTVDPWAHPSTNSHQTYNLFLPHSHCPHCNQPIRAQDNIPLLSYLFLRGKCNHCGAAISLRYPVVELASAILSIIIVALWGFTPTALAIMIFIWSLLALALIDWEHGLLPDHITLPILWLGLLANNQGLLIPISDALWGAAAGFLILWSVFWVFKWMTGKEGLGLGDAKCLAMIGAWLGWTSLPWVLLIASTLGLIVAVIQIRRKQQSRETPIPFGPYLAISSFIVLILYHFNLTAHSVY